MAAEVRPAVETDQEALLAVMTAAFRVEPDSERWPHVVEVARRWREFLVLVEGGTVLGAVRVGRDEIYVGEASTVIKGEVGHVSVLPERQGEGLGTLLMRETVAHMAAEGHQISRLGGLCRFYARFGYVPFPRRFYEFPIEPARAGAAIIGPEEFLRLEGRAASCVRPYHPARDSLERGRLLRAFYHGRTGALRVGEPQQENGGPDETGLSWVYDEGGRLYGWANAGVGFGEGTIQGAFDLGHETAAASLLRRLLLELHRRGVPRMVGRLPFDGRLESRMVEGGVSYHLKEMVTAPAGNMLLLIGLEKLVEALLPEWSRRLAEEGVNGAGAIRIRVGPEEVQVALTPSGAAIEPGARPRGCLACGVREFLLLALGHRGLEELAGEIELQASGGLMAALSAVLRREPTATGALG